MVRGIVFEGTRATGVRIVQLGQEFTVRARETIVSAGAINSPQLLMLSGIGPCEPLRSLGIELRAPFPKGHVLPDGDWSLLDPVKARPPSLRRA